MKWIVVVLKCFEISSTQPVGVESSYLDEAAPCLQLRCAA